MDIVIGAIVILGLMAAAFANATDEEERRRKLKKVQEKHPIWRRK